MQKTIILLFLMIHFTGLALAQAAFLEEFRQKWNNAADYTVEVAELMPEEAYAFKPAPEEMSFQEQILHLLSNMIWLSSSHLDGQKPARSLKAGEAAYTKAELIDLMRECFRLSGEAAAALAPARLEEKVDFFAGPMSRRQILILMNDHLTHHRGQLVVYLRLKGLKPPRYRGW